MEIDAATTREEIFMDEEVPPSPTHLVVRRNYSSAARTSPIRRLLHAPEISQVQDNNQACRTALSIPEVVECILQSLDDDYWTTNSSILSRKTPRSEPGEEVPARGSLYHCLLVSQTFNWAATRVLSRRVELKELTRLEAYTRSSASKDRLCRDLLIHRVKTCDQSKFDDIEQYRLRSLELYVCPNLVPNLQMISSGTLKKIALPGCGKVDDMVMEQIAKYCPQLEILDLRACELVTDHGLIQIANHCPRLAYLNVGRVKRAGNVTDRSIVEISMKTSVETLGLAGCAVGDEAVLSIAHHRGSQIERLSMNQCPAITDISISQLVIMAPRLQVLEIVGCHLVRNAKALCYFKVKSGALVETDQKLSAQMQVYEADAIAEFEACNDRSRRAQRRITTI